MWHFRRISLVPSCVITLLILILRGVDPHCTFPTEWRDHWHQNRIGEVVISANEISRKGRCTDNRHDYYLLENREVGCFTCLQITTRHQNILQYKESYCVGKDTIYTICGHIQINTIAHTLIREPSVPIPCPFHDAYHFSYNNNSGGFCREPASYAKPCASAAQIHLHFSHCSNAAYTYDREVDLECLGTWKEGSEQYVIGQLAGEGFTTKDSQYRCFMYNIFGTVIYAAMSADASCFGVIAPKNGPITLEFTQDVFGWPMPSCEFPNWVSGQEWQDLSGRHTFRPNADKTIVTELFRGNIRSTPREQKAYRCHRVLGRNTTETEFTIVSFTSHGCSSKYQCLKFLKRKDGVIEIHEGTYMTYETDPCLQSQMLTSNTKLLIPANTQPRQCPQQGRYRVQTGYDMCTGYVRIGCNGTSVLDILSTCSSKPGLQLECLKTWREGKKRFLVARLLGDKTGTTNCFSFRRKMKSTYFAVDNGCNKGAPNILRDVTTYTLYNHTSECDIGRKVPKAVPSENQSSQGGTLGESPYGGSYKHVDENPVRNSSSQLRTVDSFLFLSVIIWIYFRQCQFQNSPLHTSR